MESFPQSVASLIDPRDLIRLLRQQNLSLPFNLSFCAENRQAASLPQAVATACNPPDQTACSSECCQQVWQQSLNKALISQKAQIHCCPQRRLGFVLPISCGDVHIGFLLGGGPREKAMPAVAFTGSFVAGDTSRALEAGPHHPTDLTATAEEAARVVDEVGQILPRLLDRQLHSMGLARLTKSLEAARLLAREISQTPSAEEAVGMTAEAFAVLFEVPRVFIRVGLPGQTASTRAALGFSPAEIDQLENDLAGIFQANRSAVEANFDEIRGSLLAQTGLCPAYLVPLAEGERLLGLAMLLDVDLHRRDRALCDLVLDRLVARLQQLKMAETRRTERDCSAKLVAMISALSLVASQQELYRDMLEMSAELCGAESGSLMLLDEAAATLRIAVAKGMSPPVVQSVAIPIGQGIAGRAVQGGIPLMVNDIEKDDRFATRNRPRFKTKSFLCLPLKSGDRFVGVLNLADKSDGSSFTEADLHLLQSLVGHAARLIERTAFLERAGQLEKLSITDALTGLYNRRFLESRLEEEINRSQRQNQKFSLILADLDNFKTYNDVLGHLAGDHALRQVAEVLRRTAREMDIVTRYGGEEFCLILPGTGKKECLFVAERLRRAVEVEVFPGESHLPLGRLTISLGVSAYPADGNMPDSLIHAADVALYRAKHNGRNRLVLYQADLSHTLAVPNRSK